MNVLLAAGPSPLDPATLPPLRVWCCVMACAAILNDVTRRESAAASNRSASRASGFAGHHHICSRHTRRAHSAGACERHLGLVTGLMRRLLHPATWTCCQRSLPTVNRCGRHSPPGPPPMTRGPLIISWTQRGWPQACGRSLCHRGCLACLSKCQHLLDLLNGPHATPSCDE